MELKNDSKILRIYIGDADKISHSPLYELILFEAKNAGFIGCTVLRGILSFGRSQIVHSSKLFEIADDLPLVIEIIDTEEKIKSFLPKVDELIVRANCGGVVSIESASAYFYKRHEK